MQKLVIYGAGGFAREVQLLCEDLGIEVIGFLDERPQMKGKIVNGIPILGDIADLEHHLPLSGVVRSEVEVVCAGVGDPALKKKFGEKTLKAGYKIARTLVHPNVRVSKWNTLGHGSIICQGTVLTVNITVGDFVIINQNCSLGHDDTIMDYVTISPGVNISGMVTIGSGTFVGTGAGIRENITIGEWCVIGGNAFVKDDVPNRSLFAGVPAVLKKQL